MKVSLPTDQYNKLSYNAINYACGRSSYIVGIILRIIRDNIKCLDYHMINEIVKLIVNRDYGCTGITNSHNNDWRLLARDLLDITDGCTADQIEVEFLNNDDLRLLILSSFRSNLYFPDNGIVPDYNELLVNCSKYMIKNWYKVFINDIEEAIYYGVDLAPYNDVIGFIYNTERNYV